MRLIPQSKMITLSAFMLLQLNGIDVSFRDSLSFKGSQAQLILKLILFINSKKYSLTSRMYYLRVHGKVTVTLLTFQKYTSNKELDPDNVDFTANDEMYERWIKIWARINSQGYQQDNLLDSLLETFHSKLFQVGQEMHTIITKAVLSRTLKISLLANKDVVSSELIKMMQIDVEKIQTFPMIKSYMNENLYSIIFSLTLQILGGSEPINQQSKTVDIFNIIKLIKVAALEIPYFKKLANLREIELEIVHKRNKFETLPVFAMMVSVIIVALAIFLVWIIEKCHFNSAQRRLGEQKSRTYLNNVDLTVKKGEFVSIIGRFGSGKSSLFNAILGQMKNKRKSSVIISGSIAYVSQKPWIINDSPQQHHIRC